MVEIIIYTKTYCPYCIRAKELLAKKGQAFTEISIDENPTMREEMIRKSNRTTVPQIFINGQAIGGCDDMHALEHSGQLDKLLQG
ncbi:MAG: glutaredoxin 3 [Legionella sp.]